MEYELVYLPEKQWKGIVIPMRYTTEEYYDIQMEEKERDIRSDCRNAKRILRFFIIPKNMSFRINYTNRTGKKPLRGG